MGQPNTQLSIRSNLAGRSVARVGYGAMQLQRLSTDASAARRMVRHAIELGIDHIDTAPFYGAGFVDDVLRHELKAGDDVTVVSKVGAERAPRGAPFPIQLAQRPEQLRAGVEASLRGLGVEQLAIVNLRRVDTPQRVPVPQDQVVDLEDQLAAMIDMRNAGMIGDIGLSCVTAETLRKATDARIVCVQNPYSVVSRDSEDVMRICEDTGVAWVPFFPLGGGFPGARRADEDATVRAVAKSVGASASQVALAWLLHHSPATLLIPGTASVTHLEENLAAAEVSLSQEMLVALGSIDGP